MAKPYPKYKLKLIDIVCTATRNKSVSFYSSIGNKKHPSQGEYVVTGVQDRERSIEFFLGFCVQVRKGIGAFGTDQVFLRHPNGKLIVHENQGFYPVPEYLLRFMDDLFESPVEKEDYSKGYSFKGNDNRIGFLIEKEVE